jgi:hypothetical protein
MAQMWHYINFFSHKLAKVTSDFILNYLKKVVGGATTQKNLKTNTKTLISSIWIRPQGPQGCQKMPLHPINMPFEVWCAKIDPKLQNIQKGIPKQGFLTVFFSILTDFGSFCLFGAILAQELNSFISRKKKYESI